MASNPPVAPAGPGLKRVLTLPALIIYGIVLIQPTAPMPLFGVAHDNAHGHVVTLILIGMVAMLFTAFSYGWMANAYPSAGSAYAYVSREIHPAPGYLTGWSMMFDYVMNPIICVIWCSKATVDLGVLPGVPVQAWFVVYALLFTGSELARHRGQRAHQRHHRGRLGSRYRPVLLRGGPSSHSDPAGWRFRLRRRPFYDPATFLLGSHLQRRGPGRADLYRLRRHLHALGGSAQSAAQRAAGDRAGLPHHRRARLPGGLRGPVGLAQASLRVSQSRKCVRPCCRAGRRPRAFRHRDVSLLVASIGSGMGAHLGAGRLLYGMGRDNAIPRKFFGAVNRARAFPATILSRRRHRAGRGVCAGL